MEYFMKSWTIAINVAMSLEFYSPWIRLLIRLRMMLEAYQREWMMMMERPPWPPPPLIPLPQLPGGQGVQLPPGPAPIAGPKNGPNEQTAVQ